MHRSAKKLPRIPLGVAGLLTASLLSSACLQDDPTAPGTTPSIAVIAGADVVDTIGAVVGDSLVVQVTDSVGIPLSGAPLRLSTGEIGGEPAVLLRPAPSGPGVSSLDLVTGADGLVVAYPVLGERSGIADVVVTHLPSGLAESVPYRILTGDAVSLQLSPPDTVITDGEELRPRRYVYDRAGNTVTRPLTYAVTGPLAADSAGVVGAGVGYATATASIDGRSATVDVTVVPNGRVLVGGWARTGLRASRLDGSDEIARDVPGAVLWVDAAPHGRGVAFSFRHVVAGENVGGPYERLTPTEVDSEITFERWPRFSDDGAWVYFEAVRGQRTEIWRARPIGGGAEQVTEPPADMERIGDRYPAISRDGRRLSYSADRSETSDIGTLEVAELASGVVTPVGAPALSSRWSPGDDWIAFVTPDHELMRVRPDGSELAPLTSARFGAGFDWSPDGAYIVGLTPTGDPQLLVLATGDVIALPHLGRGLTLSIAWYDDPD